MAQAEALTAEDAKGEAAREAAEYDAWFRCQVQIGLDAANAGKVLTAEEMEAKASAWRTEARRRRAAKTRRMVDEVDLDRPSRG